MSDPMNLIEDVRDLIVFEEQVNTATEENLKRIVDEYLLRLAHIRDRWIDHSIIELPSDTDKLLVKKASEVLSGSGTKLERQIRKKSGVEPVDVCIYPDKSYSTEYYWETRLAYPTIFAWNYAKGVLGIGSLVIAREDVPPLLRVYAFEAREAYCRDLYQAVLALTRAMIEVCLKDLARENGIIRVREDGTIVSELPFGDNRLKSATWLCDQVCENVHKYSAYRTRFQRIIDTANPIVHAAREVTNDEAQNALRLTLNCIRDVYME